MAAVGWLVGEKEKSGNLIFCLFIFFCIRSLGKMGEGKKLKIAELFKAPKLFFGVRLAQGRKAFF